MHANLSMLAGAAASSVFLNCTHSTPETVALDAASICYVSKAGRLLQSTLLIVPESGGERLLGVTEFRPGLERDPAVRAVERANLDPSGRLLRLEATVGGAGQPDTRVVLDPPHGRVEVTTPSLHIEWSVQNDLPWVWAPLLIDRATRTPVATPLVGRAAWRAARSSDSIRLLDLGVLGSHAIHADQLVVADGERATVVVGDDTIDMDKGLPNAVHLAALGIELEPDDAGKGTARLAAVASCAPPGWSAMP